MEYSRLTIAHTLTRIADVALKREVADTLNSLAVTHLTNKRYDKAIENYKEIISIQTFLNENSTFENEKKRLESNIQLGKAYGKLGIAYGMSHRYTKAVTNLKQSQSIIQKNTTSIDTSIAMETTYLLGKMQVKQGNFLSAKQNLSKALSWMKMREGSYSGVLMQTLYSLAIAHAHLGELDEAISCYQEVLNMEHLLLTGGKKKKRDDDAIARTLFGLGLAYKAKKEYEDSLHYIDQALVVLRDGFQSNHDIVGILLDAKGTIYKALCDYDQSMEYYEEALQKKRERLGPDHIEVSETLHNMGDTYTLMQNYQKAKECYEQTIDIQTKFFGVGNHHVLISSSMHNLGVVCIHLGEYKLAMSMFVNALQIRKKILGDTHELVADTLHNMAIVHEHSNSEYYLALEKYEEALRIRRIQYGDLDSRVADTAFNIGILQAKIGHFSYSLRFFEKARNVYSCCTAVNVAKKMENTDQWIMFLKKQLAMRL